MRRGTTPTVTLRVTNSDGSDCDLTGNELYVTFKEEGSKGSKFTKRETDEGVSVAHEGKATVISVALTQKETLGFSTNSTIAVQLRCKALGIAQATTIETFKAEEILQDGEI